MHATRQQRIGFLNAVAAYGSWGLIPIYFKIIAHVPPIVVLAHRVVWSVAFLAIVISVQGLWGQVIAAGRSRRLLGLMLLSAVMLAINWLTFIYAVSHNRVLDSSLGYFMNPLVTVLLGIVFLKERLRAWQGVALGLATIGVSFLAVHVGQFPWIALSLATSFGFYGLLRKTSAVGSLLGLMWETILLLPLAIPLAMWTSVPLLCFAAGAKRLRLSTMGFLQYLAPTGQFLLAVYAYGEPFSTVHRVAFGFIWVAIAIYLYDSWRTLRQRQTPAPVEAAALAET
jgi:chloramphenicol-sensitive protein RarD